MIFSAAIFALTLGFAAQDEPPLDCANAMTTMEMNDCAALDVEAEEVRMRTYLARSIKAVRDDSDSLELGLEAASQMATAQTAWEAYVEAECGAVYTHWQGGTIRVLMALGCKRELTLERTRHLWRTFLSFPDGSEPLLPEPRPLNDRAPEAD